jgi:hypothetical protein
MLVCQALCLLRLGVLLGELTLVLLGVALCLERGGLLFLFALALLLRGAVFRLQCGGLPLLRAPARLLFGAALRFQSGGVFLVVALPLPVSGATLGLRLFQRNGGVFVAGQHRRLRVRHLAGVGRLFDLHRPLRLDHDSAPARFTRTLPFVSATLCFERPEELLLLALALFLGRAFRAE